LPFSYYGGEEGDKTFLNFQMLYRKEDRFDENIFGIEMATATEHSTLNPIIGYGPGGVCGIWEVYALSQGRPWVMEGYASQ
jgi:hypothetical protein